MALYKGRPNELERWAECYATRRAVSVHFRPVLLFRNGDAVGLGNIFTDADERERILTAGHLFESLFASSVWEFRPLRPMRDYHRMIGKAEPLPNHERLDLAFCTVGDQAIPITWASPYRSGFHPPPHFPGYTLFDKPRMLTSILTGKDVVCPASVSIDAIDYLISTYQTFDGFIQQGGESGTGFVGETGTTLYILKGSLNLLSPKAFPELKLPADQRKLAFLQPVNLAPLLKTER